MDLEKKYLEQRQWFIDRIGKVVYRCNLKCNCESCQSGKKGILIEDYDQACYMNDCRGEMGIKYYDSIEELENDIDNRAENYVKKVKISPKTYKGDVVTAYVIGATEQDEILNRRLNFLDKKTRLEKLCHNKNEWSEIMKIDYNLINYEINEKVNVLVENITYDKPKGFPRYSIEEGIIEKHQKYIAGVHDEKFCIKTNNKIIWVGKCKMEKLKPKH